MNNISEANGLKLQWVDLSSTTSGTYTWNFSVIFNQIPLVFKNIGWNSTAGVDARHLGFYTVSKTSAVTSCYNFNKQVAFAIGY